MRQQIRDLAEKQSGAHSAVLLAEEGRTRMADFARDTPGVILQQIRLPCICCPGLVDLPGALRAVEAMGRPDWVFLEVPAVAATGMMAEFDRGLGWPRELTVCLDRAWAMALREHALSPFQMMLLEQADRIVSTPAANTIQRGQDAQVCRPEQPAPLVLM
jgi:hypothetical protein